MKVHHLFFQLNILIIVEKLARDFDAQRTKLICGASSQFFSRLN